MTKTKNGFETMFWLFSGATIAAVLTYIGYDVIGIVNLIKPKKRKHD